MIRSSGFSAGGGRPLHGQLHRLAGHPVPRRADVAKGHTLRGVMSPGAVDLLAAAITTQEGGPGNLNFRNNNPGNLRYVGQAGATQGEGGFAQFSTMDVGEAALKAQINLDATRGTDAAGKPIVTVADLISSWAPASDNNNTVAYLASVEANTGFGALDPLLSLDGGPGGAADSLAFGSLDWMGSAVDAAGVASLPDASTLALGLGLAAAVWIVSRFVL